ncbi:MAG: hypothetical protein AAF206_10315 [Bacteroidota bacterium]
MRSIIPASFLLLLLTFGCNGKKISQLEEHNQNLTARTELQDSLLNDFLNAFNEFQDNLDLIKEKESLITMGTGDPEMQKEAKDQILADIQTINELLDQNRGLITELEGKLEGSEGRVRELSRTVKRLRKQLGERDKEVIALKQDLVARNFEVEQLNLTLDTLQRYSADLSLQNQQQAARISLNEEEIVRQSQVIETQSTQLNKAFYIAGTAKQLRKMNVLSKSALLKPTLNADLNESVFTEIDIQSFKRVPVRGKKAKIITKHPSSSYAMNEVRGKVQNIEIKNPESFWQTSRYLVVVLN